MPVADFAQGVTNSNYWAAHLNSLKPTPKSAVTASTDTSTDASKDKPLITTGAKDKSFFENVLDIVNPLEHLPVVSTIYHAITGNESGDLEKMAGDTLYGGPIGLASSVADIAFEKITGKGFGDTLLSMVGLGGDDKPSDKTTVMATNTAKAPDATTAALAPAAKSAQASAPFLTSISPIMPASFATPAKLTELPPTATAPAQTASATPSSATAAQNVVDISPQTDALLAALQKNGVTGPMQAQAMDAYRRSMSLKPAYTN